MLILLIKYVGSNNSNFEIDQQSNMAVTSSSCSTLRLHNLKSNHNGSENCENRTFSDHSSNTDSPTNQDNDGHNAVLPAASFLYSQLYSSQGSSIGQNQNVCQQQYQQALGNTQNENYYNFHSVLNHLTSSTNHHRQNALVPIFNSRNSSSIHRLNNESAVWRPY